MTETHASKKKSKRSRGVRVLLFLVGALLLGAFIWAAGPTEIARNVRKVGWGFFYLLALSFIWRSLATTGMWVLLTGEQRVAWWKLLLIRSAGESINMLAPFGNVAGEPIKAVMLKRELSGTESTGIVLLDKTIFFIGSVTFMTSGTFFGAIILSDHPAVLASTIALLIPWIGTLTWIVWRQRKGDFIVQVTKVLRIFRIQLSEKTLQRLSDIDRLLSIFWRDHKPRFFVSLAVHTLARCLRGADVWLCVMLLGQSITWYAAYFTAAAGMLVSTSFVFIPGGLGASEGGHAFVFEVIGLGLSAGVTVGLIRRIRNYIMAALGYLVIVFWPAAKRAKSAEQ